MVHSSIIVMNASNYNQQSSNGNSFVYKFPRQITFHPNDKIGIQSASIFNSFYNITSKLQNNELTIVFPCNNPNGSTNAIAQGFIGNSVEFTGYVTNPPTLEISGSTITSATINNFSGFVGGPKVAFTNAYISGTTLFLVSPNSAPLEATVGMFVNGTSVRITGINSTRTNNNTYTTYTLNSSSLSPLGSSTSPVNTIFACGLGNTLYVLSTPTVSYNTGPLFVQGTGLPSQNITDLVITPSTRSLTLANTTSIYVPSTYISTGVGGYSFSGTATSTVYAGMTFSFNGKTYTITQSTNQGTQYTILLDQACGMFAITTVTNVGIPNNSFSILTVTGTPIGNGIYNANTQMILSGIGINSNINILGQLSSSGGISGSTGTYKINYNPDTLSETMTASDGVTNNNVLYITSLTGVIVPTMKLQVGGRLITIDSQISGSTGSVGQYAISTPTGIIPSIYPQQIVLSGNFSKMITLDVTIPDGYYTADTLNSYLQQVMIENDLYILDGVDNQTSLFYIEVTQNPTFYSLQVNIHALPTILSPGQSYPPGATWSLLNDGTKYNPQLILSEGLTTFMGFSRAFNDTTVMFDIVNNLFLPKSISILNGVDKYYLSNVCPKLNTINSIVLCCNMINSDFSIPSNLFFNIPLSASFGNMIVLQPFQPSFFNVRGGYEQSIEITFFDTNFNPIAIRDTDITLTLVINKSDIY